MSVAEQTGNTGINSNPDPEELAEKDRREVLSRMPVSWIEQMRDNGDDESIRKIEESLQDESEKIIKQEIGLEDYRSPDEFILPKPNEDNPKADAIQKVHSKGPENGIYMPDNDSVLISTDYGILNGLKDNNLLSTSVHELIHNDTYNRLTDNDRDNNPDLLSFQIEGILFSAQSFENSDIEMESESILEELTREYEISTYELSGLGEDARNDISELSDRFNEADSSSRDRILEEAYETVNGDIDIYHLASPELEPEKESFAWLATMYIEQDLEEGREHLDRDFSGYDKADEIKNQLGDLVNAYDNLTEYGDMGNEEALKYILDEVQPRKFEYKAKKINDDIV